MPARPLPVRPKPGDTIPELDLDSSFVCCPSLPLPLVGAARVEGDEGQFRAQAPIMRPLSHCANQPAGRPASKTERRPLGGQAHARGSQLASLQSGAIIAD